MHSFVAPYTSAMKTATDANIHMTTENRFSLNEMIVDEVDASSRIIPEPYSIIISNDAQEFDISGISMANDLLLDKLRVGAVGDLRVGATDLLWKLGLSGKGDHHNVMLMFGTLHTVVSGPESYTMEITSGGTTITGTDAPGLFHGLMSFIGLLDVSNTGKMTLKEMTIYDKPRFGYRGHQVDVARNFRSKEALMKTIDAMALWKVSV